jgi:hypothetical protein
MEPYTLETVSIRGAALAAMLQSVVAGCRDCDGLLFGSFRTLTEQHLNDDDQEAVTTTEHQACISSAVCCASTCSFFNATGEVDEESLQAALPPPGSQEPMVGWLSYRRSSPLHPSMREAASSSSLYMRAARELARTQVLGQVPRGGRLPLPPVLLLLVTSHQEAHGGATLTMEYKLYQATCPSAAQQAVSSLSALGAGELPVRLSALPLSVDNLAEGLGHQKLYGSFRPTAQLPLGLTSPGLGASSGGAGPSASSNGDHGGAQLQQALEAAVAASSGQVAALEAHYNDMLRTLGALSREVADAGAVAAEATAEQARLLRELASSLA